MAPTSKVNPELDEVLARTENMLCADCGAKAPRWASVNLGILMCIECSGAHRNLGTHISVVKSTTLDKWQPKWIETVTKIGNKTGNAFYEHSLPKSQKLQEGERGKKVADWVRSKYDKKEWVPHGRASPSELLAKGLNPDYDADRSDDSRKQEEVCPKRGVDAKKGQVEGVLALKSPVKDAPKCVDLLGDDFSNPSAGAVPAQPHLATEPACCSPWTADLQVAASAAPFLHAGAVNAAIEVDHQQLLAQHMPQQCSTQLQSGERPQVLAEHMPSAKVDSLKNALGALYQQDSHAKSAQGRLAAAPWPTANQQGCAFGAFGLVAVSHEQFPCQQPQAQLWQPQKAAAAAAPCTQQPPMPSPVASAQKMTSQIDTTTAMPTNQLSALYEQALGHIATDAGLHMMQSHHRVPVAVGPGSGAGTFDIDAFSAFGGR